MVPGSRAVGDAKEPPAKGGRIHEARRNSGSVPVETGNGILRSWLGPAERRCRPLLETAVAPVPAGIIIDHLRRDPASDLYVEHGFIGSLPHGKRFLFMLGRRFGIAGRILLRRQSSQAPGTQAR